MAGGGTELTVHSSCLSDALSAAIAKLDAPIFARLSEDAPMRGIYAKGGLSVADEGAWAKALDVDSRVVIKDLDPTVRAFIEPIDKEFGRQLEIARREIEQATLSGASEPVIAAAQKAVDERWLAWEADKIWIRDQIATRKWLVSEFGRRNVTLDQAAGAMGLYESKKRKLEVELIQLHEGKQAQVDSLVNRPGDLLPQQAKLVGQIAELEQKQLQLMVVAILQSARLGEDAARARWVQGLVGKGLLTGCAIGLCVGSAGMGGFLGAGGGLVWSVLRSKALTIKDTARMYGVPPAAVLRKLGSKQLDLLATKIEAEYTKVNHLLPPPDPQRLSDAAKETVDFMNGPRQLPAGTHEN